MKKRLIIIFSLFSVLLLISLNSSSALEYNSVTAEQNKQVPLLPDAIMEKLSILGCSYTTLLLIWEVLYAFSVIGAKSMLGPTPLKYGIATTLMYVLFINGMYQIAKSGNSSVEPPAFSIPGWMKLSSGDKTAIIAYLIFMIFSRTLRISLRNTIIGS